MSTHHQTRRRQPSSRSSIIHVTDQDSDTTTPPKQTGRHETPCLTWATLALGALIPLAIGIGTVVITVQQQQNEDRRFQQIQDNEDRRRNQDQHIANWTRDQDQQQADNLHYQTVYSHYIINISNSIFKQQNQTIIFGDKRARLDYIRSQTLTALVDLDCQRKTWLFEFLHENELLPSFLQSTSMQLQGANFSCIILQSTNSKRFVFNSMLLASVDLNDASFIECHFLNGSNFSDSSMGNINFTQSIFNCSDEQSRFERAMLSHANFYGVGLCNVSFNGADLSYANFTAAVFPGRIDLTGTDLAFTTFKAVVLLDPFSVIITNANMTGASTLEDEWFKRAMSLGQIEIMNVILPNGTWLWNEMIDWIRNGNAEKDCTSLKVSDWSTIDSWSGSTVPSLPAIYLNESMNSSLGSCCFNFTSTGAVKPISMAQRIFFNDISKFIQSSEAEYHLSFDTKCQGGFIQIQFYFFTSTTGTPLRSVFMINGTDQLYWQKRTISDEIRVDTESVLVKLGRRDHTGLCYIDNIELDVRRGGRKK